MWAWTSTKVLSVRVRRRNGNRGRRKVPRCRKGAWALLSTIFSFPSKSELKFAVCGDPLENIPLVPSFQTQSICQLRLGILVLAYFAGVQFQLFPWTSFPAKPELCEMDSALTNEVQVILAVQFLEAPFPVEQFKSIHSGRARGRTYTDHLLPPLLCAWIAQPALVLPFPHFWGINFWILTDFL